TRYSCGYKMFTVAETERGTLGWNRCRWEGEMPQIIVTADKLDEDAEAPIMFRERVSVSDFESEHFAAQLVERLGWAVGDADELNCRSRLNAEQRRARQRVIDAAQREMARNQRARRSANVVTTAS